MPRRLVFLASAVVLLSTLCYAKEEPIKISTITNTTDPSSVEVMKLFRQKIGSHENLFKLVDNSDPSLGLLFTEDCMSRQTAEPYVCFYTTHYVGGTTKTFMGGGIYVSKTAGDIADNFVTAVAQDIVERWNEIARTNAIEMLESCLFLTQSSCAVPDSLAQELKVKVLNLSQYMQKGGLKK
jgi:spore cortex formation protein SpoVR/YcgB (stage V sporulation)